MTTASEVPVETRLINRDDRSWTTWEWCFLGIFERDPTSELLYARDTPAPHRKIISAAFLKLPLKLRQPAISLGLTVSTTSGASTAAGNLSTVYGFWQAIDPMEISPHLQMTTTSLSDQLILPHLAHECTHIFWACQPQQARAKYREAMSKNVDPDFLEVTEYAERAFRNWQWALAADEDNHVLTWRARTLEHWVIESLCETVGKLCHPAYGRQGASISRLLEARQAAIQECFQLMV